MPLIDSAVIIGGTSGIGRAIALRFAQEGAALVIAGRDGARGAEVVQQCADAGAAEAHFVAVDVGDPASVTALADAAGTPQVLVNSAGILQSGQHVLDQDLDQDEQLWRINYRGTLLACQVFGRLTRQAGRGALLNVGSLASFAPLSLPANRPFVMSTAQRRDLIIKPTARGTFPVRFRFLHWINGQVQDSGRGVLDTRIVVS